MTTLREKLIKIGAKVISHARYITFQLAEVSVPRKLFEIILQKIDRLRLLPETGWAQTKRNHEKKKNKRRGLSKKARLLYILHWKDTNVDQESKK